MALTPQGVLNFSYESFPSVSRGKPHIMHMDPRAEIQHLVAQAIDFKCRKGDMFEVFRLSERIISLASIDPRVKELIHLLVATPEEDEEQYMDYLKDLAI